MPYSIPGLTRLASARMNIRTALETPLHSIQLQCSSNPVNIAPFNIADNEIIFTTSQETSSDNKPFRYDKIFSFANPLARRTTNPSITEGPNQTPIRRKADNPTYAQLPPEGRFSLLKNRKVKWFLTILLIILLATIAITLTVYYVKRPTKEFLTGQFSSHYSHSFITV